MTGILAYRPNTDIPGAQGAEIEPAAPRPAHRQACRRIAIFNVKFSANLGDGIIAECMEARLRELRADWDICSVDLAGRDSYGAGLGQMRGPLLRILGGMPPAIRRFAASAALKLMISARYRRRWRSQIGHIDGAIIGGGQLFADADLNFPLKLNGALSEIAKSHAPAAIYGVGVAREMSDRARRLFVTALRGISLRHVAVRDRASRYNWDRHFGRANLPRAELCSDPGLLAGSVYGMPPPRPQSLHASPPARLRVGIGIVNPRTLDLHSSDDDDFSINASRQFWIALTNELIAQGYEVVLFTNGPTDDETFTDTIECAIDSPHVTRAPRPQVPGELVQIIHSLDALVAHRLHANILAYAFAIPHVGLAWDPKVEAFFASVGRRDFLSSHTEADPREVALLAGKAIDAGIDPDIRAEVVAAAEKTLQQCVCALDRMMADAGSA